MEESKKGLSAGRVQSVAVRLIIEREREIQSFEPEEFWTIKTEFVKGKDTFEASFYGVDGEKVQLTNETQVNEIIERLKDNAFSVENVTRKERKRNPALPFTTSSLQQEAARKLNMRAKKTMMLAQQLYEGIDLGKQGTVGLITYMRTDSTRISETAQTEARTYITEAFGTEYIGTEKKKETKKSNAQDAHEAIRPTSVMRKPEELKSFLSRDQLRLYKLIWERFVASQMASAIMDTVTARLINNNVQFRASGSVVKFPGFMKVYVESKDDGAEEKDKMLPPLEVGETVFSKDLEPKQHFTQPPPRYTEARLVRTLEELELEDRRLTYRHLKRFKTWICRFG